MGQTFRHSNFSGKGNTKKTNKYVISKGSNFIPAPLIRPPRVPDEVYDHWPNLVTWV